MGRSRGRIFWGVTAGFYLTVLLDHVNSEMPVSPPRGEVKYMSQGWSSEELRDGMGRKDRKLGVIATKMVVNNPQPRERREPRSKRRAKYISKVIWDHTT